MSITIPEKLRIDADVTLSSHSIDTYYPNHDQLRPEPAGEAAFSIPTPEPDHPLRVTLEGAFWLEPQNLIAFYLSWESAPLGLPTGGLNPYYFRRTDESPYWEEVFSVDPEVVERLDALQLFSHLT